MVKWSLYIREPNMTKTIQVWIDKQHISKMRIDVLPHVYREGMKDWWDIENYSLLISYARWHRFLDSLPDDIVGPSLGEYMQWQEEFPGWSYMPMTKNHAAWRSSYELMKSEDFPMNSYYT